VVLHPIPQVSLERVRKFTRLPGAAFNRRQSS
jgi:hypothetical protein